MAKYLHVSIHTYMCNTRMYGTDNGAAQEQFAVIVTLDRQ